MGSAHLHMLLSYSEKIKKTEKKNRENNISVVRWSEFVENHICTYSLRVILPSKAVLRVVYDLVKDISYRYLVPGKVGT